MKRFRLLLFVSLLSPWAGWAAPTFGADLVPLVELKADLDGDGRLDDIALVKVAKPPAGTRSLPLMPGLKLPPIKGGELAVAIVRHPKGKNVAYLLRHPEYFTSPMWRDGSYKELLTIGRGPEPPASAGQRPCVAVASESGALWYLHWDGRTFQGSPQGDEP